MFLVEQISNGELKLFRNSRSTSIYLLGKSSKDFNIYCVFNSLSVENIDGYSIEKQLSDFALKEGENYKHD